MKILTIYIIGNFSLLYAVANHKSIGKLSFTLNVADSIEQRLVFLFTVLEPDIMFMHLYVRGIMTHTHIHFA